MPRSTKANLPWIDAVGAKIAAGLSERHARPMIYRQSGPYNQSKKPHVGIFFNDPILHHIAPIKPGHKVDFRFGFYPERCFSPDIDAHVILAGFVMLNPTLSTRFLIPNIRSDGGTIAGKLMAWLRGQGAVGGYISLGVGEGEKYLIRGDDEPEVLADALGAYVSPLRKEGSSPWKRLHLSSITHLPEFKGWEEADLIGGSGDLAAAALGSFKRLDFLYSMLFPRDLGPSRMSGGQNRALKARQPDRRCSWACGDDCEGVVDAAHIKPDRLGVTPSPATCCGCAGSTTSCSTPTWRRRWRSTVHRCGSSLQSCPFPHPEPRPAAFPWRSGSRSRRRGPGPCP